MKIRNLLFSCIAVGAVIASLGFKQATKGVPNWATYIVTYEDNTTECAPGYTVETVLCRRNYLGPVCHIDYDNSTAYALESGVAQCVYPIRLWGF